MCLTRNRAAGLEKDQEETNKDEFILRIKDDKNKVFQFVFHNRDERRMKSAIQCAVVYEIEERDVNLAEDMRYVMHLVFRAHQQQTHRLLLPPLRLRRRRRRRRHG